MLWPGFHDGSAPGPGIRQERFLIQYGGTRPPSKGVAGVDAVGVLNGSWDQRRKHVYDYAFYAGHLGLGGFQE